MMPAFRPTGGIGAALATLDPPWVVLRQGAFSPLDGERGQIYGGIYIVLHPAKGVALVDLAPAEPETALPQLRRLLCGARLSEYPLDQVPLVAVSLAQDGLAAAEDRISEGFSRASPCAIQDGSWIEFASKALASRFPELMRVKRAEVGTPAQEREAAGRSLVRMNPEESESVALLNVPNPSNRVKHWENFGLATLTLLSGSLCAGRRLFRRVHQATTGTTSTGLTLLARSTHAGRAVAGRTFQSKAARDFASTARALPKRSMHTAQTLLVCVRPSMVAFGFASLALLARSTHAGCAVAGRICQSKAARDFASTARALPKRSMHTAQTLLVCVRRSTVAFDFASLARLARSVHAGRAVTGRHDRHTTTKSGSGVQEFLVRFLHDSAAGCYRRVFDLLPTTCAEIVAGWRVLGDAKSVDDSEGLLETDALRPEAGTALVGIEITRLPKPKQRSPWHSQLAQLKLRFNSQSTLRFVTGVKSLIIRLLPTDGWIPGWFRWRWREAMAITILLSAVATFAFFDLRDVAEQASQPRAMVVDRHVARPLEATTTLPPRAAKGSPLILAQPTAAALPIEGQRSRASATLEGAAKRTDPTQAATAPRHAKKNKARVVEDLAAKKFANAEARSIARERRAKRRALMKARTFSPYDGPEYEYANRQIQ